MILGEVVAAGLSSIWCISTKNSITTVLKMASSSNIATPPKKRMLFLHGMFMPPECYTGDKLMKPFWSALGDEDWEVTTVTSPRVCRDPAPEVLFQLLPELKGRADLPEWINSQANEDGSKVYDGLDDSLQFLRNYLASQPQFDAIVGHSNGALMASILSLTMESEKEWLPESKHCKAIVLFNAPGSYANEVQLSKKVQRHGPIQLPSIHVFGGPTDTCWEGQQELQRDLHPNGKVIVHDAGHFFPSETKYYDEIVEALNTAIKD
jgi:hypothetical protein